MNNCENENLSLNRNPYANLVPGVSGWRRRDSKWETGAESEVERYNLVNIAASMGASLDAFDFYTTITPCPDGLNDLAITLLLRETMGHSRRAVH